LKQTHVHTSCLFLLNKADNKDDRDKLVEGLKKLSKVKTIRTFSNWSAGSHQRDVMTAVIRIMAGLLLTTRQAQDSYQSDPIHLKFVEECSALWTKVIVYDSVDL
jgi:hypothetical protein